MQANAELIVRLLVGTLVHENYPVKAGYYAVIYLRSQVKAHRIAISERRILRA